MKRNTMQLNETMTWLVVLGMLILAIYVNAKYCVIAVFWIIKLVIAGNVKYLYSSKHEPVVCCIRRGLYTLPCLLPLALNLHLGLMTSHIIIYMAIAILVGILLFLPKYKSWSLILTNEIILSGAKKEKYDYISHILMLLIGAVAEEIFYRGFVIGYLEGSVPIMFSICVSCLLFFMHHFSVKWNSKFRKYDYIIQLIFAFISCLLFVFSKSIIPSIIAHLVYNSFFIVVEAKSYYLYYIKK